MKSLVIVESGAKAKKIKGFLSTNFPIKTGEEACVGHVRFTDKENAVDPSDWKTQMGIFIQGQKSYEGVKRFM